MKGSLTVEASYIFPFCFFVIGLVCYMGVFMYNQTVLKLTAYECILQAIEVEEKRMLEEDLESKAEALAQIRLLGAKELHADVKVSTTKIVLSYQAIQSILKLPLEITVVYEKTFPELTLRLM